MYDPTLLPRPDLTLPRFTTNDYRRMSAAVRHRLTSQPHGTPSWQLEGEARNILGLGLFDLRDSELLLIEQLVAAEMGAAR